jgi:ABC-2 type transport system permease protein
MTSGRLLWNRWLENGKYKARTMRLVLDWTVMVYFVIPGAVIGFFVYRSWWEEMPGWIEYIPFPLAWIAVFFILWNGHFQTYVREADRIFLLKKTDLFMGLKQGGMILSYILEMPKAGFLALLIVPFWFEYYHLNGLQLFFFISLWVTLKWLIMAASGYLNASLRGWRTLLKNIPLMIAAGAIWHTSYLAFQSHHGWGIMAICLFNMIGSMALNYRRFTSIHTFEQDLAIDERERQKQSEFLLGVSMDVEKLPTPRPIRTSPRLYSQSNRLFQKRTEAAGFLELFIKVTTRSTDYLFGYLRILGVTAAALIIVPPMWVKMGVAVAGFFALLIWCGAVWHRVVGSHPFSRKYAGKEGYQKGKTAVAALLAVPYAGMCLLYLFIMPSIQNALSLWIDG